MEEQKDYMNRPPRRRDESLFAGGGWGCTCFYGLLIAGISMLAFLQEPVGTIKSAEMTLTIPHLQAVLKDAQVLALSLIHILAVDASDCDTPVIKDLRAEGKQRGSAAGYLSLIHI